MITQILEYLFSNPVKSLWNGIKLLGSGISGGKWGSDNIYSNLWRALNGEDVTAGSSGSDLIQTLREQGSSWLNTQTQAHMTGAQVEQNAWTAAREDTVYQRSVSDMLNAGLNPALMYGSAGPTSTSASASGGSGASLSDLLGLITLPMQLEAMDAQLKKTKADTANVKANTANTEANTENVKKRTEWIDAVNQAEIDSKKASTNLSEGRLREIDANINESKARIEKLKEEAKTEVAKRDLMYSQLILNRANSDRIAALLPYEKLYLNAQTESERSEAGFKIVETAYKWGLIDNGYIEAFCKSMNAEASIKDVEAALASPNYVSDAFGDPNIAQGLVSSVRNVIKMVSPFK